MQSAYIRRTATDAHDEFGIYAVSVFLALDEPVPALCGREPFLARYGKVRRSTVGRLRAEGFALLPTLRRPHYDVVLADVTDGTLARLDACFGEPEVNPARR